jgi:hypothetical protein
LTPKSDRSAKEVMNYIEKEFSYLGCGVKPHPKEASVESRCQPAASSQKKCRNLLLKLKDCGLVSW